jgi:hypothetical protein
VEYICIGSLVLAALVAICAIAPCMLSSEISQWEEDNGWRDIDG